MARPIEPEVRAEILKKCLKVALSRKTLHISINDYGEEIGSSGRMLAYYFKTKADLDQQIIQLLEAELRSDVMSFADKSSQKKFLLRLWDFLTKSKELRPKLILMLEVAAKSSRDQSLRSMMDGEMNIWLEIMQGHIGHEKDNILFGFHILQGALLDFLITGNAQRGRKSLMRFAEHASMET